MRMARVDNFARWLFAAMLLSVALGAHGQAAQAQTCGGDYTIKEGELLADVATRVYGNSSQWPLIFYANQDRMGANASMLVPGLSIRVPCMGSKASAGAAAPAVAVAPPVETPGRAGLFKRRHRIVVGCETNPIPDRRWLHPLHRSHAF